MDAATVVLPTPPFPVTKSSLRSSRGVMVETLDARGGSAAEADATALVRPADLEVRDLLGGHAHLAALAVGEPEHGSVGQRLGDVGLQDVGIGVGGELDVELLGGLADPD